MKYEKCLNPQDLLEYMNENINYGFVGNNGKTYKEPGNDDWNKDWYEECIVQNAESLIKSHYGTCWDQVELERKWFEEHSYQYKTVFMWFEVNKDNNLPTHTFLIYMKDGKFYWFEHALETQKGTHEFNDEETLLEYVKNKLLEFAMQNSDATANDKQFIRCYEYIKPESNLNVDEYIYHVTHSFEENKKHI